MMKANDYMYNPTESVKTVLNITEKVIKRLNLNSFQQIAIYDIIQKELELPELINFLSYVEDKNNNQLINSTARSLDYLIDFYAAPVSKDELIQHMVNLGFLNEKKSKNGSRKIFIIPKKSSWFGINVELYDGCNETVPYFWDGKFSIILKAIAENMKLKSDAFNGCVSVS
ncbi:hypothetical protein [Orbus mooreae]|uniref:hypothetical protein n=1 Tax=Orbus mooreae TaxID=3074107 RepID=UPI00370D20E0